MRAEAERRYEGAFEMHPEDGGVVGTGLGRIVTRSLYCGCDVAMDARDFFERGGDRGREPCGGAFARETASEGEQRIGRRGHHVDSVRAVDLEIDEAGQDVVVADVSIGIERGDSIGEIQMTAEQ